MKRRMILFFLTQPIVIASIAQNVGIGTPTPQFPFDIVGRVRIQAATLNNANTSSGIWLTDNRNNSNLIFAGMADSVNYGFYSERSGIGWQFFFDGRYGNIGVGRKPGSGSTKISLDHTSGGGIAFYTGGSYNGYISGASGNLNIAGASASSVCFPLPCTPPPPGNLNFWPIEPCVNPPCINLFNPGRTGFYTTDPKARVHIVAGNATTGVLIGASTLNPAAGYMLNVGGKIICEEVRVQLNASWPDYVFEPDYARPNLNDLEQIVKNNKHLPGIPSAAQVKSDAGISVGDFQRKLLEKLEELYLYVFELNKENKELKAEIETLKQK